VFPKKRLKKYDYYPILREAYNLTNEQCDYLARVVEYNQGDKAIESGWNTIHANDLDGLRIAEDLRIKFNTEDPELIRKFGEWLMTGECPVTPTDTPKLKFCVSEPNGCGLAYAIYQFPFWPMDERCAGCIKRCVAPEPTYHKRLEAGRALQAMMTITKRPDVMSPHISHVVGQIMTLEGGAAGFAQHVHHHLVALREKDPACYAVGKMYIALMNLIALSTKLDNETLNLDDIDDAGLKRYLQDMLLQKLTKEEAVRYIQDAVTETDQLVLNAKQQAEERRAEATFSTIG
jgi:hypothetical protein